MVPKHLSIKRRIINNELMGYKFIDDYPRIGEALVLYFCTNPFEVAVPIEDTERYVNILAEWNLRQILKGAAV